jgi:hypothetical protein
MTPFDLSAASVHREPEHEGSYDGAIAEAERCFRAGHLVSAKHAFLRAHALGRDQTRTHVQTHLGLLRVAVAAEAWFEVAGQMALVAVAQLFTRTPRVAALPQGCTSR